MAASIVGVFVGPRIDFSGDGVRGLEHILVYWTRGGGNKHYTYPEDSDTGKQPAHQGRTND